MIAFMYASRKSLIEISFLKHNIWNANFKPKKNWIYLFSFADIIKYLMTLFKSIYDKWIYIIYTLWYNDIMI